jgi:hypothetical protein
LVNYKEKSFVTLASAVIKTSGSSTLPPQELGLRLGACLKVDVGMLFCLFMESLALKHKKEKKTLHYNQAGLPCFILLVT